MNSVRIQYLLHSGFLVDLDDTVLIFDYYTGNGPFQGKSCDGYINPEDWKNREVFVFASHHHPDHFDPRIFSWQNTIPHIHYILSDDIHVKKKDTSMTFLPPGATVDLENITVQTFSSTDIGVAFLVFLKGLHIFHAGDLNWWHWNGESYSYNQNMKARYCREIDLLAKNSLDIAFVPFDPRLEDAYFLGMDYFLKKVSCKMVFPMHFWEDYSLFTKPLEDPRELEIRNRIVPISHRGQAFLFDPLSTP